VALGSQPVLTASTWRPSAELLARLPFVLLAVLLCYRFDWTGLRYLTSEAALQFAQWRGYEATRLGNDLISWGGAHFQFGIACTFADVFCGAIPLLWVRKFGLAHNGAIIAVFAALLFACNLIRLAGTDLLFSAGVPSSIADNAMGGLGYFAAWICFVRWFERHAGPATSITAATPSAVTP